MTNKIDSSIHQRFSSRIGFLLSALGIAIGTGNIWRFPRITAQSGGETGAGAFLIAWVAFLFMWSIPLIIAEYGLGRTFRKGVVGSFMRAAGDKFAWMGTFVSFVATAITFYYSVVVGWCIFYFIKMLTGALPTSTDAAMQIWDGYQSSGWPLLFHAIAMAFGAWAIWRGVSSIEKVNKVLIPILFGIVIISVVRALTLPGAWDGIAYLFTPQWSQLVHPKIWLEALTQNAWDTGAGWGLLLTYAAYLKKEHGVVKSAFITGIGNNTVSLLAALMVFGTVFSILQTEMGMARPEVLEIMKTSGPASTGLTFIWMPQLFARMVMGHPIAALFFLGLTFAGFSSLIALIELPVRVCIDAGMKRPVAILTVAGISYLLGIPSAINLNILGNQDFVWGVALMISGAFVATTVMKYGVHALRMNEFQRDNDMHLGAWWEWVIKLFVPVAALILLVWWLSLATTFGQWYNPFDPYSLMTCVVQWAIALGLCIGFNRWLVGKNRHAGS
ncbi:sodium-dependent transporter [candidate division KSB1 bacterium]|nr:sodium-dependent transporter [candidate division KSB1 bacterium]